MYYMINNGHKDFIHHVLTILLHLILSLLLRLFNLLYLCSQILQNAMPLLSYTFTDTLLISRN